MTRGDESFLRLLVFFLCGREIFWEFAMAKKKASADRAPDGVTGNAKVPIAFFSPVSIILRFLFRERFMIFLGLGFLGVEVCVS